MNHHHHHFSVTSHLVLPCVPPLLHVRALIITAFTSVAALSTTHNGNARKLLLGYSSLHSHYLSASATTLTVWDNVLSTTNSQGALLQEYAIISGLGHRCFRRPLMSDDAIGLNNHNSNNIIERTIDAILTEIENNNNNNNNNVNSLSDDDHGRRCQCYVEYWARQEWRHIEAHADIDENLAKQFDQAKLSSVGVDIDNLQAAYPTTYQKEYGHRYPTFGHVLYLQVGANVKGPTCVFPGRGSGGDLLRPTNNEKSKGGDTFIEDGKSNNAKEEIDNEVSLCIVPAVAGRLLRFDGRDLHAVPRPTDIWMLPFVQGSAKFEPKEEWGRSVILFNVWPGDEDPPLDVPFYGTNSDDTDMMEQHTTGSTSFCNSFNDWKEIPITIQESSSLLESESNVESNASVKVWLLGNERRRNHPMRTVPLVVPSKGGSDALRDALNKRSQVTAIQLRKQKS